MRILFGIMSAVQPVQPLAALCDAIGRRHPVLIHHDFSQQAEFKLERPNVTFVENPARTGWATWAFSDGILRLLESALKRNDWDYFQLLSPTCMPIRPLAELEAHLAASDADYFVDAVDLVSEPRLLMSHGWRAYAQAGVWRHRLLRMARRWYLGDNATNANFGGLSFPLTSLAGAGGLLALRARLGLSLTQAASRGLAFGHVFSKDFRCYAGSTWFGASRKGCAYVASKGQEGAVLEYFKGMHMPDEMFFPSLFKNSELRGAPSLHYVSRFIDARPAWIGEADLDEVLSSGKYFARKFPEEVDCEVRHELARRVAAQSR
jgi:hypothetical protein